METGYEEIIYYNDSFTLVKCTYPDGNGDMYSYYTVEVERSIYEDFEVEVMLDKCDNVELQDTSELNPFPVKYKELYCGVYIRYSTYGYDYGADADYVKKFIRVLNDFLELENYCKENLPKETDW